jgi:hypothetical protein
MVRAVNDRHARVGMAEVFTECQPTETRAQHHDVNLLVANHAPNVSEAAGNAIARKDYSNKSGTLNTLAFDEPEQEQEHNGANERADQFTSLAGGAQAEQFEQATTEHCADDAHDHVAQDAETVTFNNDTRQKPGG